MGKMFKSKAPPSKEAAGAPPAASATEVERASYPAGMVTTPIPRLTWRSAVMGVFVSMGGFLFGYDTGQISGILEMEDFKRRFGEPGRKDYMFSNVRAGLIVALVRIPPFSWMHPSEQGLISLASRSFGG